MFGLVAVACGERRRHQRRRAGARASDSIVVGTTDSLQNSFDPAQAYDLFASTIDFNTAETLVTYAPNATEPSPLLAAAMPTVSADGTVYTFELRPGVKFHDGTALDSAAVKFSLERARDFGNKDAEAAGFLLTSIKSIATPSPHHGRDHPRQAQRDVPVPARLHRGQHRQPHRLQGPTSWPAPRTGPAVLAKYKTDTVVGTGPYKLASYKEKESLTLEANPDYWGDRAQDRAGPDPPVRQVVGPQAGPAEQGDRRRLPGPAARRPQLLPRPEPGSRWSRARARASATSCSTSPSRRSTTSTCARRWRPPSTARRSPPRC